MKILDIALKDMTQSLRSMIAIMFMFVVPILMTGMFYIMFGGSGGDDEGFVLPSTKLILVNQDTGNFGGAFAASEAGTPEEFAHNPEGANITSIGDLMTELLQADELAEIMDVSVIKDEDHAREAVDNQQAGVAVIIPTNLTDAYMAPGGRAVIEIYQDPTLSIGPAIVKGIISQFLDNFSGSKIALGVTIEQLYSSGVPVDDGQVQALIAQYIQIAQPGNAEQSDGLSPWLDVRAPEGTTTSSDQSIGFIAMIMTGMTGFFVFFTGASTAQSILREEETGTLPRLFTTPTSAATIMSGKFLSVALTISVQLAVLLLFGYFVFHINWGNLVSVISMSVAITIAASAFGIFLISWLKTERQAGVVIGGLVTIMGMAGMMPIYVMGMPNPPAFVTTISRFVPQGWAVEGLQRTMLGGGLSDTYLNAVVLLIWGAVFFAIGIARFRKRYV